MATEQDIKTLNSGRTRNLKVLVLSTFAAGQLAKVIRLDGKGNGNEFIVSARELSN